MHYSQPFPLDDIKSVSINLINEDNIHNNDIELEKLQNLIDRQKRKGNKYPLLASVFLLFREARKDTLTKSELYSLMEKLSLRDKNKIISSPTERYTIINPYNYKAKIKDIIKKKKWFTRRMNNNGEIEYTLNEGAVYLVTPKIITYLNCIDKRDDIFQSNAKEILDNLNSEKIGKKEKKSKITKESKDLKNEEKVSKEFSINTVRSKNDKSAKKKMKKEEIISIREEKEVKKINNKNKNMKNTKKMTLKKRKKSNDNFTQNIKKKTRLVKSMANIIEIKDSAFDDDYDIIIDEGTNDNLNKHLKLKSEKNFLSNERQFKSEYGDEEEINMSQKDETENITNTNTEIINTNINNSNIIDLSDKKVKNKFLNKKRKPDKTKKKINKKIIKKNNNIIKTRNNKNNNKTNKTKKLEDINSSLISINKRKNQNIRKTYSYTNSPIRIQLNEEDNIQKNKKNENINEQNGNHILNKKINSIISIGEIFLNLINNNGLSQLALRKISSLKKKIEKKEKEIQSEKLFIEKLVQTEKKVKDVNNKEIENILRSTKINYKEYKDKIELLLMYKEIIDKSENKEDIKNVLNNYNKVYEKCYEILGKMMTNVSMIFNDYLNLDEFVNMLCVKEKDSWIEENIGINNKEFKKDFINIKNIEDLGVLFQKELDNTLIDNKIKGVLKNELNNINNNIIEQKKIEEKKNVEEDKIGEKNFVKDKNDEDEKNIDEEENIDEENNSDDDDEEEEEKNNEEDKNMEEIENNDTNDIVEKKIDEEKNTEEEKKIFEEGNIDEEKKVDEERNNNNEENIHEEKNFDEEKKMDEEGNIDDEEQKMDENKIEIEAMKSNLESNLTTYAVNNPNSNISDFNGDLFDNYNNNNTNSHDD